MDVKFSLWTEIVSRLIKIMWYSYAMFLFKYVLDKELILEVMNISMNQ